MCIPPCSAGMFMPSIDVLGASFFGAALFSGVADVGAAFFLGPAFFFGATFSFAAGLDGIGIFMPAIGWAAAGAATSEAAIEVQRRSGRAFRDNSLGIAPPALGRRCINSAIAILAGAGVAAAVAAIRAAAIAFGFCFLAIRHFGSPFCIAPIERITI